MVVSGQRLKRSALSFTAAGSPMAVSTPENFCLRLAQADPALT